MASRGILGKNELIILFLLGSTTGFGILLPAIGIAGIFALAKL